MSERNKKIVAEVNAAFGRGDVEAFLEHCSDDFLWDMAGHPPVRGKEALRKVLTSGPVDPPTFGVDTFIAEGDFVVAQGDMTMKENGVVVPYAYCDVWRFRGDRLIEVKAFVVKTGGKTAS